MQTALIVLMATLVGVLSCVPLRGALRGKDFELARGLGALIASFVTLSSSVLVVRVLAREQTLVFGAVAILVFLTGATLLALRAEG